MNKSSIPLKPLKPVEPSKPREPTRLTEQELQQVVKTGKGSRLLQEMAYSSLLLPKVDEKRRGFPYSCPEDFFLKHGQLFTPRPFPSKYSKLHGELGNCSINAFLLACTFEELHYVEGVALTSKIAGDSPMLHAWCVDNDGNVVDPTWRDELMGQEYCGLVFKLLPLSNLHFRRMIFGFAFNDKYFNQILSGEIKPRDWKTWLQKPLIPLKSLKLIKPRTKSG